MPRVNRTDIADHIYHILNRANARVQIFDNDLDYQLFEIILEQAVEKFEMRLLSYCIMPNHWHLVVYPKENGDLAKFMGWLSNTHTKRWHSVKKTTGQGHLYQGRYKSFICQEDNHFIALAYYVERNAKKAGLCKLAQDWRWSSVWRREYGTDQQKKILSVWPTKAPENYLTHLNQSQLGTKEELIEKSIERGSPYGEDSWMQRIIKKFKLDATVSPRGRPKKGG